MLEKKKVTPSTQDEEWGSEEDEEVQMSAAEAKRKILEATGTDAIPPKRRGFGKRSGPAAAPKGKNPIIATLLSIIISVVLAIGAVMYLSPSKAQFTTLGNQVNSFNSSIDSSSKALDGKASISSVSILSTTVGDASSGLVKTVADLGTKIDGYTVPDAYTRAEVDSKLAGFIPITSATPKVTLLSGGCNVSVNGSGVSNIAVNILSGSTWSKDITTPCVFNLTATSDTGHSYYGTFAGWNVNGLVYTSNPLSISVSTDTFITAISTGTGNIVSYTLTYTAGTNGSISGITPQTVYRGSNGSQIIAIANSGYAFSNWSDTSTQNPRTDTNILGPVTVTANFVSCAATIPTGLYPAAGSIAIGSYTGNINWSDCNTNSYTLTVLGVGDYPCFSTYTPSVSQYAFTVGVNTSYYCTVNAYGCSGTPVQATSWMFNVVP